MGGFGSSLTALAPLPIEVQVQDISMLVPTDPKSVTVQFLVRNIGTGPIDVPASRDTAGVLTSDNKGRRELGLSLIVQPLGTGKSFSFSMAPAAGAISVPGSMVTLPPGRSLVIRTVCESFDISDAEERETTLGMADVNVRVTEYALENRRYVIEQYFESVLSTNTVRVYWPFRVRRRPDPLTGRVK